ncbi:(2Fe-2S)-binding protein [Actinosynnema sp. CA-299493]
MSGPRAGRRGARCCLFYRTPTGHTCRACPLVDAAVTRRTRPAGG